MQPQEDKKRQVSSTAATSPTKRAALQLRFASPPASPSLQRSILSFYRTLLLPWNHAKYVRYEERTSSSSAIWCSNLRRCKDISLVCWVQNLGPVTLEPAFFSLPYCSPLNLPRCLRLRQFRLSFTFHLVNSREPIPLQSALKQNLFRMNSNFWVALA